MDEVVSGHMKGSRRLMRGNKKDIFPESMTQDQVAKAIRNEYRHGTRGKSQGSDRIFITGPFGKKGRIESKRQ